MGFVRAMDALRGMKLLFKDDHESFTVNIGVDFDKNKHLSDACIRRRKIVRDRYIAIDKDKEEKARKEAEEEKKKKEKERFAEYFYNFNLYVTDKNLMVVFISNCWIARNNFKFIFKKFLA